MTRRTTRSLLVAALCLSLSLGACGDGGGGSLSQQAAALASYYGSHPPDRGWQVQGVTPEPKDGKLVVEMLVTSDADIDRIRSLSRMEQFSAAKIACPKMTPELRAAIGEKTRVWVRLKTPDKDLTASICPG